MKHRGFTAMFVAVSVLGSMPTETHAEEIVTLVRGKGAGSDKAAAFVAHFLREQFRADERYEMTDLGYTLGNPRMERSAASIEVARESVELARLAYEALELDPAIEYLNDAVDRFEQSSAYMTDLHEVADALMLLGATHILRGEQKTGARRLSQAAAMVPDVEPDSRIFNPTMREVFQGAVEILAKRKPGTLSLSSNPSYAEVYVDGRFVGVTPAVIEDIPVGRHFVRLVRDGYRNWGRVIDVDPGSESAETATLTTTTQFEDFDAAVDDALMIFEQERLDPKLPDVVEHIQLSLPNVDQIVLARVRLDGERVEMSVVQYDLNSLRAVSDGRQVFSYGSNPEIYAREVADLHSRVFAPGTEGDSGFGGEPASNLGLEYVGNENCYGMSCDDFKLVVLASSIGGGALFMGVGGILWSVAKGNNDEYKVTAQVSPDASSLKSAGQLKALLGDGLFVIGLGAALAGTGYFLFSSPEATVEDVVGDSAQFSLQCVPLSDGAWLGTTLRW